MNKTEQHIDRVGNVRWAVPNARYYWFVGGAYDNEAHYRRMQSKLARDMLALVVSATRRNEKVVALYSSTQSHPWMRTLAELPGWNCIAFGPNDLQIARPDAVCFASSDSILVYGKPNNSFTTQYEELEHPPEILYRNTASPGRAAAQIQKKEGNPYARYDADAHRLRKWKTNPQPGLLMREVDVRPKYSV